LGLPIPEELTLLTGGIFVNWASSGFTPPWPSVSLESWRDLAIYAIGKKWARTFSITPFAQGHHESRLDKGRQFFRITEKKTVFIARFISGFRCRLFAAG